MIPTYTNTTTSTNTSTNLVIPQQGGDYSEGTGGYVQTVRKGMAKTGASKGLRPGITQAIQAAARLRASWPGPGRVISAD